MPSCLETKLTLSGETKTYPCELLHYETGFGVLRYIIDREYDIAGLKLAPGDETIALYWEDRPYTVYIWRRKAGERAYYFNIADKVSLSPRSFVWRDLAVDVLVDDRGLHILDEHELPADIDPGLARSIRSATALVMSNHRAIIEEADAAVQRYAPPSN
jgi:hypothetical protein